MGAIPHTEVEKSGRKGQKAPQHRKQKDREQRACGGEKDKEIAVSSGGRNHCCRTWSTINKKSPKRTKETRESTANAGKKETTKKIARLGRRSVKKRLDFFPDDSPSSNFFFNYVY
jgi:hypothetical protein